MALCYCGRMLLCCWCICCACCVQLQRPSCLVNCWPSLRCTCIAELYTIQSGSQPWLACIDGEGGDVIDKVDWLFVKMTGCRRRLCVRLLWPCRKSNQLICEPKYISDQNWVKSHSLVFELWCSQVHGMHRHMHSLTHSRTDRPDYRMPPRVVFITVAEP